MFHISSQFTIIRRIAFALFTFAPLLLAQARRSPKLIRPTTNSILAPGRSSPATFKFCPRRSTPRNSATVSSRERKLSPSIVAVTTPCAAIFAPATSPSFFPCALPEGNYRVTVTFGDASGESSTTVKAELRRLMLEHVHTEPGKFIARSFIVNIRTPKIAGGGEVRLKPREKTSEASAWDDKLTLEFNDARPAWPRWKLPLPTTCPRCICSAIRPCAISPASRGIVGAKCCRDSSSRAWPWPIMPNRANPCAGRWAQTARQSAEHDEARRLSVHPIRPQRHEGKGRGHRRVHHLQNRPETTSSPRPASTAAFRCWSPPCTARSSMTPAKSSTPWAIIPRPCGKRPRKKTCR